MKPGESFAVSLPQLHKQFFTMRSHQCFAIDHFRAEFMVPLNRLVPCLFSISQDLTFELTF
jgi:hypothetical protein